MDDNLSRRLRGVIGNALVWGVGWGALWVLAVVAFSLLGVLGLTPGFSWLEALGAAIRFGVAFGVLGFVAGGAFSTLFGLVYRGRRLSGISAVRVGLGGAILAGAFVPLFLQTMNVLSGDGMVAWDLLLSDGILSAVFGGIAAGGSVKLAQLSNLSLSDGRPRRLEG